MKNFPLVSVLVLCGAAVAHACDSCAIAIATGETRAGFILSATEQFTHLGSLRLDGSRSANPAGQFLNSAIAHLNLGYSDGGRWAYQLTLPYIQRSFRRPEDDGIERGTESGWGDAVAVARCAVQGNATVNSAWQVGVFGGVKFATGSASRIAEELSETEDGNGVPSGIHGHDLTLGSGSTDALVGVDGRWNAGRYFAGGSAQYSVRSKGKYDYRFANEFLWSAHAGWYAALTHEYSVAIAAVLSGENKGRDTFAGETAEDTGMNACYLGPRVALTAGDRWGADFVMEWPVRQHNTALQAVADYRWRAGATLRF